jgi:hypothetical protein
MAWSTVCRTPVNGVLVVEAPACGIELDQLIAHLGFFRAREALDLPVSNWRLWWKEMPTARWYGTGRQHVVRALAGVASLLMSCLEGEGKGSRYGMMW